MASVVYATTGPGALYNTIGWFNFASLPTSVTPGQSFTLVNDMLGGASITATFTFSSTNPAMTFSGQVPPLWAGAAFGNTAYKGITQKVCLREGGTGTGTIVVTNILLKDKYGVTIPNYNFYFTDSETPATGETETFITNGSPWQVFYTLPNTGYGFATLAGVGTTVVNATGLGNVPLLLTKSPTQISQTVLGAGAMSFGISLTYAEIYKVVSNRISSNDQFKLDIVGPNSGTTITVGTAIGLQSQSVTATSGSDGYFTFNETMAPGSSSSLSYYTQTIQLSNKAAGGTTLPSTLALGQGVTLVNGDYAVMTITNTPLATAVTLKKSVDKNYVELGETLSYTLIVTNTSPYPVNSVIVRDTIPNNSSFVSGSLQVNGVTVPGSPAPPTGVAIGTIVAGGVTTLNFKVLVTSTLPAPNTIINNANVSFSPTINSGSVNALAVVTTIVTTSITATKGVSKTSGKVGDTIGYTIVLRNTGNTTANNILFIDTVPKGTTLVAGSFKQDSTPISTSSSAPGATLPNNLNAGSTTTITFIVTITEIPVPNPIANAASLTYSYTLIPTIPNGVSKGVTTNTVNTVVNNANLNGATKTVDKAYSYCGDTLTYSISIPNNGNVTALNVILKDTIPTGTVFVTDSMYVNGVQQIGANPASGVTIGSIAPGTTTVVRFQVVVQPSFLS